jgi:polar amino acid transport system permease protein
VSGLDPAGDRRSRILTRPSSPVAYVAIALASTIVVFGGITLVVVNSSGWPRVKETFFDRAEFRAAFPSVAQHFLLDVKIFLVAEVAILILALALAVVRSLPGPVCFPLRAMAIVYTDLFRGVPTILVVYLLAFGIPALQLSGVSSSAVVWGTVGLILVYTAYVTEVYRAGIESVHPSQEAAARSLGLSRWQTMRAVIIPQAVRRVIPPLLNDFIGLQKDTALLGLVGPVEAFQRSNIYAQGDFNFTPYLCAAVLFVAITIPLARFTDWLVERDRRRFRAGGAA